MKGGKSLWSVGGFAGMASGRRGGQWPGKRGQGGGGGEPGDGREIQKVEFIRQHLAISEGEGSLGCVSGWRVRPPHGPRTLGRS